MDERVTAAGNRLAAEAAKIPPVQEQVAPSGPHADRAANPDEVMATFRAELAGGIGTPLKARS